MIAGRYIADSARIACADESLKVWRTLRRQSDRRRLLWVGIKIKVVHIEETRLNSSSPATLRSAYPGEPEQRLGDLYSFQPDRRQAHRRLGCAQMNAIPIQRQSPIYYTVMHSDRMLRNLPINMAHHLPSFFLSPVGSFPLPGSGFSSFISLFGTPLTLTSLSALFPITSLSSFFPLTFSSFSSCCCRF